MEIKTIFCLFSSDLSSERMQMQPKATTFSWQCQTNAAILELCGAFQALLHPLRRVRGGTKRKLSRAEFTTPVTIRLWRKTLAIQ